jgi:sulfatase maturation enzyme AslB (radical SAM superfamily)
MVAYAKGSGLRTVRFATNATLLNENLAHDLIEAGLDSLTVSMDASCAKRYCPGLSGHELITDLDQKILRLIALRNQRGLGSPEVHMQIVHMESTQDLIDDFVQRWEGVADRVTVKPLLSWAGHIKAPGKKPMRRLICVNHLAQGVVLWDGDVSFCCLYIDSEGDAAGIIGNAAHIPLEDIFLGEKRRVFMEAQLRGNYAVVPYCKECPDWNEYLNWDRMEKRSIAGVEA